MITENIILKNLQTDNGITIPNRKAVIDVANNRVLGVVSPRYKLIKNNDLMNAVIPAVEDLGFKSEPEVKSTKGGSVTFFKFLSNKIQDEVQKGDIVQFGVEFFNSYDGSMPIGFHIIAVRLVCTNGLVVPKSIRELSIRHMKSASPITIKNELNDYFDKTKDALNIWKSWTNIRPDLTTAKNLLKEITGSRLSNQLLNQYQALPDKEQTLWGFYNVLTYHITHQLKNRKADVKVLRQFNLNERIANRLNQEIFK